MDTFEVAVLRILIKRQHPMKLHTLVSGFPDDSEDAVFSAISNLKLHEYIILSDYHLNGYISVDRKRRKEILKIVDSDIISKPLYVERQEIWEKPADVKNKSSRKVYLLSPRATGIIIASLLVTGLFTILGFSLPSTSTDAEMVAYIHHGYVHWSAFGGNNEGNSNLLSGTMHLLYVPVKDCEDARVNAFVSS